MQQTSKYQFKLIEGTDDFSPTPLNDNMEKVEDALEALDASVAEQLGDVEDAMDTLEAGVESSLANLTAALGTGGHTCRMAYGTYTGSGQYGENHPNSLTFDFTPVLIIIGTVGSVETEAFPGMLFRGMNMGHSVYTYGDSPLYTTWTDHGVSWYSADSTHYQMSLNNTPYQYIALGYSGTEA